MLARRTVQFHWRNAGYAQFDDFLAALTQPKRKKIRAERRKVAEAGVALQRRVGHEITEADWEFFSSLLSLDLLGAPFDALPEPRFLPAAGRADAGAACCSCSPNVAGEPIAASLGSANRRQRARRLFGRYWGAIEHVPCLHFEAATTR